MSTWSVLFGAASTSGCLKAYCGLESIVDPPLETSESTDHQDSGKETSPQALESDLSINSADFLPSGSLFFTLGVKLGDDSISGMRNDSAEDTSEISWSKSDAQLCCLVVVFLALGENVVIEELYKPFESNELDNGVRDLSSPQRTDSLVKTRNSLIEKCIPSCVLAWLRAGINELGYSCPGLESWIFSLTASQGHNKTSAMISADPDATDHPTFLYLSAFYSPTMFL